MTAAVERALSAVRTIRASGAEEREVAGRRRQRRGGPTTPACGWPGSRRWSSPASSIAVQGAFLAVLGVGGYRVATGSISVADLVAFILYLFLLVMPLGQAISAWTQLQTGLGALARIQEMLALGPEDDRAPSAARPPRARAGAPATVSAAGARRRPLRAIPTGPQVLRGVSLDGRRRQPGRAGRPVGRGQVDDPGAGRGLLPADGGAVRWAGTDVRDLPRAALRARLGYVEQEAPVLAGTVRDNLLLAAPDATDPELWAVLADVGLTDVVQRSPARPRRAGRRRGRAALRRRAPAAGDRPLAAGPARRCCCSTSRPPASTPATRACCATPWPRPPPTGRCWWWRTGCPPCSTATRSSSSTAGRVVARGTHEELVDASPLYRELATAQLWLRLRPAPDRMRPAARAAEPRTVRVDAAMAHQSGADQAVRDDVPRCADVPRSMPAEDDAVEPAATGAHQ